MNKTTLSENIKKLGLRLFEDKTASELEDIIKEIFPSAEVMSDFVNYKNNLGHITFNLSKSSKSYKVALQLVFSFISLTVF